MANQYFATSFLTTADFDTAIDLTASGDNVFIAPFVGVFADGASADGIGSAFGLHRIEILGNLGSAQARGIALGAGSNFITIATGASILADTAGIECSSGGNQITNLGLITSATDNALSLSGTGNFVDNQGTMRSGNAAISMVDGEIVNHGTIHSFGGPAVFALSFALNELSIVNFGILKGSGGTAVFCQAGAEQVYNHGTIVGSVNLGDGIDLYDASFGGTVQGLIDLGTGDDTGIGGDQRDVFIAGTGNDDIDGGGGDDTFRAGVASGTDGNDIFDGGTGRDTFNATDSANAVFVNLAEGYARGARIGNDTLIDIERAIGSVGGDTLTGDDLNNVLVGLNGNDTLIGGVGIDRIDGGNNNDFLTGGAGRDILTGGAGIDNFIFTAATDSGITNATRDRITDFLAGTDDIDVSALAGTFTFIGTGPFTAAGNQIRFQAEGTDTLVEISTDTDTDAEMSILLVGTIVLTAGDFDI